MKLSILHWTWTWAYIYEYQGRIFILIHKPLPKRCGFLIRNMWLKIFQFQTNQKCKLTWISGNLFDWLKVLSFVIILLSCEGHWFVLQLYSMHAWIIGLPSEQFTYIWILGSSISGQMDASNMHSRVFSNNNAN